MTAASPTDSDIQTVVRSFLTAILPSSVEVRQAQANRVPEPRCPDFVTVTQRRRDRIETNIDDYADASFVGEILGTVMTITDVRGGALAVGSIIFGTGVAPLSSVVSFGTGTGGLGTYNIAPAQSVPPGTVISAGNATYLQPTKLTYQLDVHGPAASDNAQTISTLWRDDYGVRFFQALDLRMAPIDADNPIQVPFMDGEQEYEQRWIVDAVLQANITVTRPQQFADVVDVGLVNVEAAYPAT